MGDEILKELRRVIDEIRIKVEKDDEDKDNREKRRLARTELMEILIRQVSPVIYGKTKWGESYERVYEENGWKDERDEPVKVFERQVGKSMTMAIFLAACMMSIPRFKKTYCSPNSSKYRGIRMIRKIEQILHECNVDVVTKEETKIVVQGNCGEDDVRIVQL